MSYIVRLGMAIAIGYISIVMAWSFFESIVNLDREIEIFLQNK